MTSKAAADAWRGSGAKKLSEHPPVEKPRREATTKKSKPGATTDGPREAFERQRAIEREAHRMAMTAVRERRPDAPKLVSTHAMATRNLVESRQAVLDLEEREQALVSGDWVRKVMLDHDAAVAALAKSMPRQLSARINPADPEGAHAILEKWVQDVFLSTLHKTDPWASS